MIIDVKATKQAPIEPDPPQKYALKSMERRSKIPFALGMVLASLALYFKSFVSISQSTSKVQEENPEQTGDPEEVPEQVASAANIPAPPVSEANPEAGDRPSSGGRLIESFPETYFFQVPSSELAFNFEIDFRMVQNSWAGAKPLIIAALAANDNGVVPPRIGGGFASAAAPSYGDPDAPPSDGPGDEGDRPDGSNENEGEERANRAPRSSGPVYLLDLSGCALLAISLSELLRNAVDPDGDALSIRNLRTSHAELTFSAGQWLFQSGPKFEGVVALTYEITDGEFFIEQIAYISVQRNTIEGTNADDSIVGSDCGENINGGSGDDNLYGLGGHDVIHGGDGDDHIVAGYGDDIVFGGRGDDIIFGGAGNDHLSGGDGADYLSGDDGDDILFGDAGDDRLFGGAGNDFLDGGNGDDVLDGGAGDDVLKDGNGRDRTFAGSGDDLLIAAVDGVDDCHDGGEGFDTLDYSATSAGIVIDLEEGVAAGSEIGVDTFSSFEAVVGGTGDDHFIAGRNDTLLTGGGGDDVFEFRGPGAGAEPSSPASYTILDFNVGDRIRMSKYDIFEKVLDKFEDQFEAIYGDDFDDDDIAIRYRHDHTDEMTRTVIEVDFNLDGIWETTVMVEGARAFVIIEHA